MLARSPIYDPTRILLAAGGRIALRLLLVTTALLMISLLVTTSTTTPDRLSRTRVELACLDNAIMAYLIAQGCSPPDLQALVEAGVLPSLPKDGWGQALSYRRAWTDPRVVRYTICSLGPDGVPGTGDDLCLGGELRSSSGLPT